MKRGVNHENFVKIPTNSWDFPVFVNCNARSVSPKIDELQVLCHDVKAVTESWLSEDIPSSVVHLNGYCDQIRNDRKDRKGGGVIAYNKEGLSYKHWPELESADLESLWLTIQPKREPRQTSVIIVGVIYHPPPPTKDGPTINHINQSLEWLLQKYPFTGIMLVW